MFLYILCIIRCVHYLAIGEINIYHVLAKWTDFVWTDYVGTKIEIPLIANASY